MLLALGFRLNILYRLFNSGLTPFDKCDNRIIRFFQGVSSAFRGITFAIRASGHDRIRNHDRQLFACPFPSESKSAGRIIPRIAPFLRTEVPVDLGLCFLIF